MLVSYIDVRRDYCVLAEHGEDVKNTILLKRYKDLEPSLAKEDKDSCNYYFYNAYQESINLRHLVRFVWDGELSVESVISPILIDYNFGRLKKIIGEKFDNLLFVNFTDEFIDNFMWEFANNQNISRKKVYTLPSLETSRGEEDEARKSKYKIVLRKAVNTVSRTDNAIIINYSGMTFEGRSFIENWSSLFVL
jgi:hypothetical protein